MCGRYTIVAKVQEIEKRFKVEVPEMYTPRFNAAPTQILPVITNENPEGISFFHWGLIPQWAKDKSISSKLINARSETLAEKASFKHALKSRRCLVIADGYYEWKKSVKKTKIPYRICIKSRKLFTMAGLWEEYEDDDESVVHTFTIVTTASNSNLSHIHERMPAILNEKDEMKWIDNSLSSDEHLEFLKPFDPNFVEYYSVSSRVNNVRNDSEDLIASVPAMDQHGNLTLFD